MTEGEGIETIGVLGVGKAGTVLARLVSAAGYRVLVAGSGSVDEILLLTEVITPGAVARTAAQVVEESDMVILAVPLAKYRSIPIEGMDGKLVVDAMNYWWPIDGVLPEFETGEETSSEVVQEFLPTARIVKTFNHMGYHELEENARPFGDFDRKALAIAGDDPAAVTLVASVVNAMGFDTVEAGLLAESGPLQPGNELFNATVNRTQVLAILERFDGRATQTPLQKSA
jgi:predicted dinucleotide-binding enzyme